MNFGRSFIHLMIQESKGTMRPNTRYSVAFMNSSSLIVPGWLEPWHSVVECLDSLDSKLSITIRCSLRSLYIFMPQGCKDVGGGGKEIMAWILLVWWIWIFKVIFFGDRLDIEEVKDIKANRQPVAYRLVQIWPVWYHFVPGDVPYDLLNIGLLVTSFHLSF